MDSKRLCTFNLSTCLKKREYYNLSESFLQRLIYEHYEQKNAWTELSNPLCFYLIESSPT